MDKKKLSETDIITKFIMPAVKSAGWNLMTQIPPLAEQHRIVAKVDELMSLCDQLKTRLADAQATQLHLADAVVENPLN